MNILSFEFIIFISIVFLLTMITNGIIRKILLLISNIFFLLSFGNFIHLFWLVITSVFTYVMGILINKNHNKYPLALGIVPVVLSLFFLCFTVKIAPMECKHSWAYLFWIYAVRNNREDYLFEN